MSEDNGYIERVRHNLLPLSVAQNLDDAFAEWFFTGHLKDWEDPIMSCEMCEHLQLRYHFRIKNKFTNHTLDVGSKCILKWGVVVRDSDGRILDVAGASQELNRAIQNLQMQKCLEALDKAAANDDNPMLQRALDFYREHGCLTPRFAYIVLWCLQTNKIDHTPASFKISLKLPGARHSLEGMPSTRLHLIWPALSLSQQTTATKLGHTAP